MKRPDWIRASVSFGYRSEKFRKVLGSSGLNTVCVEADCPNKGECWENGSATFIILGDVCTRDCVFCNVKKGIPLDAEAEEPLNIARTINELEIKYAVITSVTRDDIADAGAKHFVRTVAAIKDNCPLIPVELLIPDFSARAELLKEVSLSGAEVIGHNIEMPETLYASLRPSASYHNSLNVLKHLVSLKTTGNVFFVKSSIMLGLGEKEPDILRTIRDIKQTGTDIIYLGQYLSPSKEHWPVKKYYSPEEFSKFKNICEDMGFKAVLSGPMVRSSYRAHEIYLELTSLGTTKRS